MSEEVLGTARLILRRPVAADAEAIFERYASDPEVTRYLAWPTHRSLADTEGFLAFNDREWARWPAGPLLVFLRSDGRLLGSTGLGFESLHEASTGFVLAREAWGQGYATEVVQVMVELAGALGVGRLKAICHHAHRASRHVLEKAGFRHEGLLPRHVVFPNLSADPQDVCLYDRGAGGFPS
jgi:ribosomal-protein-alanine N-acetyltransferase